jgi:hypothetical protein
MPTHAPMPNTVAKPSTADPISSVADQKSSHLVLHAVKLVRYETGR